jgi:hypothetical protein
VRKDMNLVAMMVVLKVALRDVMMVEEKVLNLVAEMVAMKEKN